MRIVRVILWALGGIFLAFVLAVAVIYAMACMAPSSYEPESYNDEQQKQALDDFVNRILDFGNQAGAGRPFTWTITAAQANAYLASLDAIASLVDEPAHPTAEMERAGFTGPAVAMREGVLTLMVHANRYDKVLSVDLAFDFDAQGDLTVRTVAMRVGRLPVPRGYLRDARQRMHLELARLLAEAERIEDALLGPVPVGRLASLLRHVLGALDGEYVRPEFLWPLGKHRVLVEGVDIADGSLTLRVLPIPRRPTAASTAGNRAGAT